MTAIVLAGCGQADNSTPHPSPAPPPGQATAPTAPADVIHVGAKSDQQGTGFYDSMKDDWSGFDIDIARYVSNAVFQKKPEFNIVTSGTRDDRLEGDHSIAFNAATETMAPPVTARLIFAGPYMQTPQGFLVNKKKNPRLRTLNDVKKLGPACVAKGSYSARPADTDKVSVIAMKTYSECLNAVKHGNRVAVTTDVVILEGLRRQRGFEDLTLLKDDDGNYVTVGDGSYAWGLAFRPEDDKNCRKAAEAIKTAIRDGIWGNWFRNHFGDIPGSMFQPDPDDIDKFSCLLDKPGGNTKAQH